jgi:hypothetical protein
MQRCGVGGQIEWNFANERFKGGQSIFQIESKVYEGSKHLIKLLAILLVE